MKLLERSGEQWLFSLGAVEKSLFCHILGLYPCVPAAYPRLNKSGSIPDAEAGQRLLDEALAEHRSENKKHLAAFLKAKRTFSRRKDGWRFSVTMAEIEWLLQVFNDIRVGSWVALGSPEERLEKLTEETAPHYAAMEVAGSFQMALLEAFEQA